MVGLDIGLGVGVAFSLLVVVYKTILPFSPRLGEARAWQYLPNQLDENFDEEELKVKEEGMKEKGGRCIATYIRGSLF